MKLLEAYKALNLSSSATDEEVKKKYRELTKLYHPDVNKEKDAEEKIKKINKAYEVIKNRNDSKVTRTYQSHEPQNINLKITISFKESVTGCPRDLKYTREVKCADCDGSGTIRMNNGCTGCGGKGQIINKSGNSVFIGSCHKCYGKIPTQSCKACDQSGTLSHDTSVNVKIPGGVQSGNVLRLAGMGNYIGSNFVFMDQSTDVLLEIIVEKHETLSIKNRNVISEIDISLYEAILGCSKEVETIDGPKEIKINKLSKNKDCVTIPNMGVERQGNQEVWLNVIYPNNIEEIAELNLKGNN